MNGSVTYFQIEASQNKDTIKLLGGIVMALYFLILLCIPIDGNIKYSKKLYLRQRALILLISRGSKIRKDMVLFPFYQLGHCWRTERFRDMIFKINITRQLFLLA